MDFDDETAFHSRLGYGDEDELEADPVATSEDERPRILLMGLRRSGKSSIVKVVFQKMSPHETLFLESTSRIVRSDVANNSYVQFQIWDFPGQIDFFDATFDAQTIFGACGALVFVIDAQEDDYADSLSRLIRTVAKAHSINPSIVFDVFIHKVDGISEDHKISARRRIEQQVAEELEDAQLKIDILYHLTSIYDHSVFQAFSKVIQRLVPQLSTLVNLMDMFVRKSRMEKSFLFDVVSKTYIATDSSPVFPLTFELCSDMIDVVVDTTAIYGTSPDIEGFEFDENTSSVMKLNNGMVLFLREVNHYLALVSILREENFDKIGLIDYNFSCLREAIADVFAKTSKK
eukprot:TRINITY_DN2096_c0_g1_i1.p1 TRINITY_DN2096_c0_g1~~TRINITY_DN2096_c0_g1_i1.p1  ORF type:complete len:346 (-),score=81.05 TRINITY_DN2096_c0_g1_i1:259-1296(-)